MDTLAQSQIELNNKAFISGSGFQGKWRKWKNAGSCNK